MSNTPTTTEDVLRRHPEKVADILNKLNLKNPDDANWSYDNAVRDSEEYQLGQDLKGIESFICNAGNHFLALKGTRKDSPTRKETVSIDTKVLAKDPTKIPEEVYGVSKKPEGKSLWMWMTNCGASPGWNEVVLLGGVSSETATVIRLAADGFWPERALLMISQEGHDGWRSVLTNSRGHLEGFDTRLGSTMGVWAETGELKGASGASEQMLNDTPMRVLTPDEIEWVGNSFPGGFIQDKLTWENINKQLARNYKTPDIDEGDDHNDPEIHTKRMEKGRKWAWGEGFGANDLKLLEALKCDQHQSEIVSPLERLMGHKIKNQEKTYPAFEMIEAMAMGDEPIDAYQKATKNTSTKQNRSNPHGV